MNIKELLEKCLIKEVNVSVPVYSEKHSGMGNEYIMGYNVSGFTQSSIKQLDIDKLITLLSKFVKVNDIIDE